MPGSLLQSQAAPERTLVDALGLPLAAYRRDHVQSCVMRTMARERVQDVASLVELIDSDADVRLRLRRAITVSTTGLFRDPNQLRWVDAHVMPAITNGAKYARAWSAGCAAGEEAFTLAMMLEWRGMNGRSEVVGTDILEEALEEAATGVVGGARIPPGLRERVEWDHRDLVTGGAPRSEFDIVLCRNLLSFLTPIAADAVAKTLAGSLAIGGVLVVGRDERVEAAGGLGLEAITPTAYRRIR